MNIKRLRGLLGYTQNEFARRYGIPFRTIQNWENETRKPPKYILTFLEKQVKLDLINHKTNIIPKKDINKKNLPDRKDYISSFSWLEAINEELNGKVIFALDEALMCEDYFNGRDDEYIIWVYGDDSLMDYNGVVVLGNDINRNHIKERKGVKYTSFNRTLMDSLTNINILDTQGITEALSEYYYCNKESFDNLYVSPEYQDLFDSISKEAIEYYDKN